MVKTKRSTRSAKGDPKRTKSSNKDMSDKSETVSRGSGSLWVHPKYRFRDYNGETRFDPPKKVNMEE